MSSSYKPALLKALVRIAPTPADVEISFDRLGAEFLRLYWTQTVVFRLRQASSLAKEPEVVQEIRRVATANRVRDLRELSITEREKLESRLARILPINVIDAFHASAPASMPPLFERATKNSIRHTADTQAFMRENAGALLAIANLWWASYLEKVNQLAPLIIQKVERDGARRTSHVGGEIFGATSLARWTALFLLRSDGVRRPKGPRGPCDSLELHAFRSTVGPCFGVRAL
jgi:hypothetical protein